MELLNTLVSVDRLPGGSRPDAATRLHVEIVTDFSRLESLAPDWNRLFTAVSPAGGMFQSWAWARAFWRVHGDQLRLCTPVVFEGDTVIGILPIAVRGRTARFLGDPYADYNGVLCAPERGPLVVRLAMAALLSAPVPWTRCALAGVLADSPLLHDGPDAPEWLRSRRQVTFGYVRSATVNEGGVLRKFARKHALVNKENRLKRAGRVSMRYVEDRGEILSAHLDRFFEMQLARQALMGVRGPFLAEKGRQMVRELVGELDPARELRFAVLELDDRPLAYHLGFEHAGKLTLYMTTFDVDFWNESPGAVLLRKAFEWANERNLTELDFTIGDEDYKSRYANRTGETYAVHFDRNARSIGARVGRLLRTRRDTVRRQPEKAARARRARAMLRDTVRRLNHPAGLLRAACGSRWPGVSNGENSFVCRPARPMASPSEVTIRRLTLKELGLLRLRHACVDAATAEAGRMAVMQGQAIYEVSVGPDAYLFWVTFTGDRAPREATAGPLPPISAIREGLILDGSPLRKLPVALAALLSAAQGSGEVRVYSRHPGAVLEAARLAGHDITPEERPAAPAAETAVVSTPVLESAE